MPSESLGFGEQKQLSAAERLHTPAGFCCAVGSGKCAAPHMLSRRVLGCCAATCQKHECLWCESKGAGEAAALTPCSGREHNWGEQHCEQVSNRPVSSGDPASQGSRSWSVQHPAQPKQGTRCFQDSSEAAAGAFAAGGTCWSSSAGVVYVSLPAAGAALLQLKWSMGLPM